MTSKRGAWGYGLATVTADGQVLTFTVGPIAFDQSSFPPEHLREHACRAVSSCPRVALALVEQ